MPGQVPDTKIRISAALKEAPSSNKLRILKMAHLSEIWR